MKTIQLIPVSQWVYDLYKVTYWSAAGRALNSIYLASSCESHLETDANEFSPRECEYFTWEVVKENVGHPRVIGSFYGRDMHESSREHGLRLSAQLTDAQ